MEALVVYPASRATRWLVRLVRIAFLISLALTVGLLLVRYLQQGPALVPQADLLLVVAGCVSLTMVALRTDLAWQLFLAGGDVFCEPRRGATWDSLLPLRWHWILPLRGQCLTSLLHLAAAVCWGLLGQSSFVILAVAVVTVAAEVVCWLPLGWARRPIGRVPQSRSMGMAIGERGDNGNPEVTATPVGLANANLTHDAVLPAEDALWEHEECDAEYADESIEADLIQFQERRRHGGVEAIQGLTRIRFTTDQRTLIAHVVFHPPLPAIPEVSVEWVEGPEGQVRVSQVETFGIRFELRLNRTPTGEGSVVFQYSATAVPSAEQGEP